MVPAALEMLQDTTSKHKSHLFDLNCQICSDKLKEDELLKEQDKVDEQTKHKKQHSHAPKRTDKVILVHNLTIWTQNIPI